VNTNDETAIIFDFDGTIADSFLITLKVLYGLRHSEPLPDEDISRLRGMNVAELLYELHVPWWRAFFIIRRIRHMMRSHMREITLVPGMNEALHDLQKRHKLFILSANSSTNIRAFLHRFELESYFADVYGEANPFSKKHKLAEIIQHNRLLSARTWYVGDETEDIDAARHVGINAVAVTWGYSNLHMLKSHHPNALVFNPDELRSLFSPQ